MQSSTGQYSTHAGDPAHPVQHSVITASSFGFFLRAVVIPLERGSCFCSSGTIPGAFATSRSAAMSSCHFLYYHHIFTHVPHSGPQAPPPRLNSTSSHARAREALPDIRAIIVLSRGSMHEFVIHFRGNVKEFVHAAIREL